MIKNGDIFITKLERGFYGAFRVIKTKGKFDFSDNEFYLIAVTTYIDKEKPKLSDKRLLEVLREKRFSYNNRPNINIYSGNIIEKTFEYLGNIPLTSQEQKWRMKIGDGTDGGFPRCGAVQKEFGHQAFLEWRWENEKDLLLPEREQKEKKAEMKIHKRNRLSKRIMDDETFWLIIALFDRNGDNDDAIVEPAIKHLAKMKISEIKQFEEALTYKLYCLDTKEHAKNIGEYSYNEEDDYVSVDFFLYARCKAVANGQKFYEMVLKDPKKMPKDEDFEVLLSIAGTAYERKTKKDFDYSTGCSYETYSNKDGWK